jgi:hypothetical protein
MTGALVDTGHAQRKTLMPTYIYKKESGQDESCLTVMNFADVQM